MNHVECSTTPDRGWGSSPRVARMHAFGVTGRSGAGRDASATAGPYDPRRAALKTGGSLSAVGGRS